jgi:tetratricopeptide (TPR) repeat protein
VGAFSVRQVGVWHDSITLWTHTLDAAGESATAYANLAETLENQGDLVNATRYYRKSADLVPNKVAAHVNLGNALQKQNLLDEARAQFETIIRIAPDSPVGYTNLGVLLLRQKKFDEAAKMLDEATDRRPDAEKNLAYVNRAAVEEDRDQFGRAAEFYRRALEIAPDDVKALAGLGVALWRQGDKEEGEKQLRKAVKLDPGFARPHNLLGMVLWDKKDYAGATEEFIQEIHASQEPAKGWYNLGLLNARRELYLEAADYFANAVECDPSSIPCRRALERALEVLERQGLLQQANQIRRRVSHLMPKPN